MSSSEMFNLVETDPNSLAKLITEGRVDITEKNMVGENLLHTACCYGRLELVELLLEKGLGLNSKDVFGNTPLFDACRQNQVETVKFLLERVDLDLNAQDFSGGTPLTVAVRNNYKELVTLLTSDVRTDRTKGGFLLHLACQKGYLEIGKELVFPELIDVNLKDYGERTALLVACLYNQLEMVKLLLEEDLALDPNIGDEQGRTPLFLACRMRNQEMVRLLLNDKRVDPNIPDHERQTPLGVISRYGGAPLILNMLLEDPRTQITREFQEPYDNFAEIIRRDSFGEVEKILEFPYHFNTWLALQYSTHPSVTDRIHEYMKNPFPFQRRGRLARLEDLNICSIAFLIGKKELVLNNEIPELLIDQKKRRFVKIIDGIFGQCQPRFFDILVQGLYGRKITDFLHKLQIISLLKILDDITWMPKKVDAGEKGEKELEWCD